MNNEEKRELDRAWKVIVIIWSAIFISLPVYLAVCYLLAWQNVLKPDLSVPLNSLAMVLIGVSGATLFGAFFIRKKILAVDQLQVSADWLQQVKARYTGATIISAVLTESIGIYGLVLFMISQNFVLLYQFLLVSAVGLFFFRPRRKELMEFAAKMRR